MRGLLRQVLGAQQLRRYISNSIQLPRAELRVRTYSRHYRADGTVRRTVKERKKSIRDCVALLQDSATMARVTQVDPAWREVKNICIWLHPLHAFIVRTEYASPFQVAPHAFALKLEFNL